MLMVKAHAKINLALGVVGKRSDGYHLLESIMLPLELHDRVEVEIIPSNYGGTFITCDDISVPTDETNLVHKAFALMKQKFNFKQEFRIHIHKIIPLSAGLGGGSADAAAVINALNRILKLNLSRENLIDIAYQIGADVPFCLFNRPAYVTGIGEKLEEIKCHDRYYVLLAKPKEGLSTRQIFNDYDTMQIDKKVDMKELKAALQKGDDQDIAGNMINALEEPAFIRMPSVQKIKEKLVELGFTKVLMTGSGTCVVCLSKDLKALQKAESEINSLAYFTKITETLS